MSGSTDPQRYVEAYFRDCERQFYALSQQGYVVETRMQNVWTDCVLVKLQDRDGNVMYAVQGKKGYKIVTDDFSTAALETCHAGNARKEPFILKINDFFFAVSHKGSLQTGTRWKTANECHQHGLRKLEFMAPKLSDEEIYERSHEWAQRKMRAGKKVLEREAVAEAQKQQEIEEMSEQGFGAW